MSRYWYSELSNRMRIYLLTPFFLVLMILPKNLMLEKQKSAVDKRKSFLKLLTDLSKTFGCLSQELLVRKSFLKLLTGLSKTFGCLSQELLVIKLYTYRFTIAALRMIHGYLTSKKQRIKVKSPYIFHTVLIILERKYCLVYHKDLS